MHVHDDRVDDIGWKLSASALEAGLGVNGQEKSVNSVPCRQGETGGLNAAPPRPEGDFLRPREPFPGAVGTCGGILCVPRCAVLAKTSTAPWGQHELGYGLLADFVGPGHWLVTFWGSSSRFLE